MNKFELEKIRKAKYNYLKQWRKRNSEYSRNWLKQAYRKDPERFKRYQDKYWLKKAEELEQ